MYGPHLKPPEYAQSDAKERHSRHRAEERPEAALLEAPLCDLFQAGTDTRHSLKTPQEGLSVSTQHMRCAEGLRLPP